MKIPSFKNRIVQLIFCVVVISIIGCNINTSYENWKLVSRRNYDIYCSDFYNQSTAKHYFGTSGIIEGVNNDPNFFTSKVTCLKYDTTCKNVAIDSNSKDFQFIEFNNLKTFTRMYKTYKTKIFIRGDYYRLNDSIVLKTHEVIDNCKNTTNVDTTNKIRMNCDSTGGFISFKKDFLVNKLILKYRNSDTLILRENIKYQDFGLIDYTFVKCK